MKDYYKLLEVHPSASQDVIAKAYKVLAKKYHPDVYQGTGNIKEAESKFKDISEAYEVLSDEARRKEYDEELRQEEQSHTIDIDQYEDLKNYCEELESKINAVNNASYTQQSQAQPQNQPQQQNYNNYYYNNPRQDMENQAFKDAMYKAYRDTYYNTLRSLGYKIHYKKSFKEMVKSLIALAITFAIVAIIGFILFQIPAFRAYIDSLLFFK